MNNQAALSWLIPLIAILAFVAAGGWTQIVRRGAFLKMRIGRLSIGYPLFFLGT